MKSEDSLKKSNELIVDLVVLPEEAGERLDTYLSKQLSSTGEVLGTRAYFKRLISKGAIKINDDYAEKPSYKIKINDKVEISLINDDFEGDLKPEKIPLDIEYEDDEFLFVNKPSGMVVHPGAGNPTGTLANGLLHHLHSAVVEDSSVEASRKVGLAHRLDKDTSGGILVVKNSHLLWKVMTKFADRSVTKFYLAICYHEDSSKTSSSGDYIELDMSTLTNKVDKYIDTKAFKDFDKVAGFLSRHIGDRRKVMISESKGRYAETFYKVLGEVRFKDEIEDKLAAESVNKYSLVLLSPISGRLHQLRVHMKSVGLPILGDPVYGKGHEVFGAMFLHSYYLGFSLELFGKKEIGAKLHKEFRAKLPEFWKKSGLKVRYI